MVDVRRRRSVSHALLLQLLSDQLERWRRDRPASGVSVVDLGGGTGGMAIEIAQLGYRVRVVDPSPDALASLERRTSEAGLSARVEGTQGDTSDLADLIGSAGCDVVVCHRVLEEVDRPAEALSAMAAVTRGGGALSLLVSQRQALVLTQALAGHIAQARRTLADRTRLDYPSVIDLVKGSGFEVLESHGIGAIADHVSESVVGAEPGAHAELFALEMEASQDPAFRALAPGLHVFARRP